MKKTKRIYHGRPIYKDDNGKLFVDSGNARLYLSGKTVKEIESRKRKEK